MWNWSFDVRVGAPRLTIAPPIETFWQAVERESQIINKVDLRHNWTVDVDSTDDDPAEWSQDCSWCVLDVRWSFAVVNHVVGVRHFDADKDLYFGGGVVIRQRNVVQMRPVSLDVGPVDDGTINVEIWYCFRLIDAKTRDAVGRQQLKI